jgi:glycosidase
MPRFEFHVRADVRDKYGIDDAIFSITGNVVFANFHAAHVVAQKLNAGRDLQQHPELAVKASQLNAMGLIDEIYHFILRLYEETTNPRVFERATAHLTRRFGVEKLNRLIAEFTRQFPPVDVHRGRITLEEYLAGSTAGKSHREIVIEEIILLYFANFNTAFRPFAELFDDSILQAETIYADAIESLDAFFRMEPPFGPDNQFVFDLLRAPILANPDDLEAQLEFIRTKWGLILSEKFLKRMLGARDFIREESKLFFLGGDVQTFVPKYTGDETYGLDIVDIERFTEDIDWMPKIVLIAKNAFVWLDQLSKKYRRSITRLDEIPDEELDQLARWNITGLWLIGVWERSPASRTIKQIMGNPEAMASAYSLYDNEIAHVLGGEGAFRNLRHRAWERGIRLAGDMVPNHVGLYSRWVVEHPDWFIQSDFSPFPNYSFTGPNLSDHPTIEVRIEDGYWTRRDAAVVFQRLDRSNGSVRYLYHGNDGTHMPWNDTAQLDFLRSDVREAVIQTIFHVARKFSVIRFDAAMVLTKKHFHRLWYPQPGSGGDIPSRAMFAMTKEEFDRHFPNEFWREVVDRINAEMPNTLLLAEAFWLLEGYFVRSLGMHRVYNSAFMHMLTKQENAKYRELIRNTLTYNPEILKRYVNFMSNPDEATAIAQFGKEDKYFGVAVTMITLPGLPMIGHGQIEGFTEKYGMEYGRAYYDEQPDAELIRRHEREIFPILKKRYLFSQAANFELYDFIDADGNLNEDVFAYSNREGVERALVFYNNRFDRSAGWVRMSVEKVRGHADKYTSRVSLAEGLGIRGDDRIYYLFRDHRSGLEYCRSGRQIHEEGMYAELDGYQYQLFMDFREVYDATGEYGTLARRLDGRGVPDVHQSLREIALMPFHDALRSILTDANVQLVVDYCFAGTRMDAEQLKGIEEGLDAAVREAKNAGATVPDDGTSISTEFTAARNARSGKKAAAAASKSTSTPRAADSDGALVFADVQDAPTRAAAFFCRMIAVRLGGAKNFDQLQLQRAFDQALQTVLTDGERREIVELVRVLLQADQVMVAPGDRANNFSGRLARLMDDGIVRSYIGANEYNGVWYFRKERFEEMIRWLASLDMLRNRALQKQRATVTERRKVTSAATAMVKQLEDLARASSYELDRLKAHLTRTVNDNAVEREDRKPMKQL